jgi:molybdate/tungstate transport system ATP-binding protein
MTLELDSLRKAYSGFELGPIDLSVEREVLSVLGPSGCGKTTLLWSIAGLLQPDGGNVVLGGRSLVGLPPEARNAGLVFQDGALFPNMTVRENVAYASSDPEYASELVDMLEIQSVLDRRPQTLSGGERQRVALARTLATKPDVLLLDEPLSSLDAPIRRRLRDELYGLFRSLALPVVLVTHDQRTATALGDRIAVLGEGTVRQVGSPSDVLRKPNSRFVADFTGNENLFEAEVIDRGDGGVTLQVEGITLKANAVPTGDSTITACVHPSRIRVRSLAADSPTDDENAVRGTVDRWLNEGDTYRIVVRVERTSLSLAATVPPAAFEQLSVRGEPRLRLQIPPDAIHLIQAGDSSQNREVR